jgi:hypothetical protein
MPTLRERISPTAPAAPRNATSRDPLWLRYGDLVKLGFSPETSAIVAEAPVPLHTITRLLVPDAR